MIKPSFYLYIITFHDFSIKMNPDFHHNRDSRYDRRLVYFPPRFETFVGPIQPNGNIKLGVRRYWLENGIPVTHQIETVCQIDRVGAGKYIFHFAFYDNSGQYYHSTDMILDEIMKNFDEYCAIQWYEEETNRQNTVVFQPIEEDHVIETKFNGDSFCNTGCFHWLLDRFPFIKDIWPLSH